MSLLLQGLEHGASAPKGLLFTDIMHLGQRVRLHVQRWPGLLLQVANNWVGLQDDVLMGICVSEDGPPDSAFLCVGSRLFGVAPVGYQLGRTEPLGAGRGGWRFLVFKNWGWEYY